MVEEDDEDEDTRTRTTSAVGHGGEKKSSRDSISAFGSKGPTQNVEPGREVSGAV